MNLAGFQNEPMSLDANKFWAVFMRNSIFQIWMKKLEKVKTLLNSVDVGSNEQWTQILSA